MQAREGPQIEFAQKEFVKRSPSLAIRSMLGVGATWSRIPQFDEPELAWVMGYEAEVVGADGELAGVVAVADTVAVTVAVALAESGTEAVAVSVAVTVSVSVAVTVAETRKRRIPTCTNRFHRSAKALASWSCASWDIALAAGIAGGADIILIPEIPWRMDPIARKIDDLRKRDRNFALVVVAEAVLTEEGEPVMGWIGKSRKNYGGIGYYVGEAIANRTGAETRVTVLGHVQPGPGGMPAALERDGVPGAFGLLAMTNQERGSRWEPLFHCAH